MIFLKEIPYCRKHDTRNLLACPSGRRASESFVTLRLPKELLKLEVLEIEAVITRHCESDVRRMWQSPNNGNQRKNILFLQRVPNEEIATSLVPHSSQ